MLVGLVCLVREERQEARSSISCSQFSVFILSLFKSGAPVSSKWIWSTSSLQNGCIWYTVTPRAAEDGLQAAEMERIEPSFLVSVCCPGFTTVEQHVEHASHIDADLDLNRKVLVCSHSRAKSSKRRGCLPTRASSSETKTQLQ